MYSSTAHSSGELIARASAMRIGLLLLLLATRCNSGAAEKRSSPTLSVPQRLAAGGVSRFGAQLITYPADAMRTLAQTRTGAKTLSELGVGTLVSGCVTTSAFAFVVGAVQFAIFGVLQQTLGALGASTVGALGSCLASVPQEARILPPRACGAARNPKVPTCSGWQVIKQRLVTGIYPNFGAAVRTIWATEGVRGFYAGWLPTITRNVPFVRISGLTRTRNTGAQIARHGSWLPLQAERSERHGLQCAPKTFGSAPCGVISSLGGDHLHELRGAAAAEARRRGDQG